MKQIVISLLAFLLATLLFWAGGFNFNHRGEGMTMWLITSMYLSGAVYFCPIWSK